MPDDAPRTTLLTVVETVDVDALVRFFADELGLRVDRVSPADAPDEVTMSGLGASILIRRSAIYGPAHLLIETGEIDRDTDRWPTVPRLAPNGTVIEVRRRSEEPRIPESRPVLSIVRAADEPTAGTGRAGMHYCDLLPGRWGGRFVASRIRLPGGGVADWVHYHQVRFQMIYCASGWVDVVYEDQGDAFRLAAGDCVLQPPGIRHRVLRASPDIEVIELSCPAVHDTISDHDLELPTGVVRPERAFGGQRFVRHVAAAAPTAPWLVPGLDARDTGIGAATGGLAGAVVVTATDPATVDAGWLTHDDELVFDAVLGGAAELALRSAAGERTESLVAGDAVALPPGTEWRWSAWSDDVELLEVAIGAGAVRPSP